jgi:hypothetical protein
MHGFVQFDHLSQWTNWLVFAGSVVAILAAGTAVTQKIDALAAVSPRQCVVSALPPASAAWWS